MRSIRSVIGAKLQPDQVTSLRALAASVGIGGPVDLIGLLMVPAELLVFHSTITTPPGTALGGTVDQWWPLYGQRAHARQRLRPLHLP
jgi:hypothetical protein